MSDSGNPDLKPFASLISAGISPRALIANLAPHLTLPEDADAISLWRTFLTLIEPPKRKKLHQYNTISDAIKLIRQSKKIVVLSGAGISTSAGLPDFRSRNGIYVQIHAEHPDLSDPKYMFDIEYFRKNPLPFYQFAKALYPGQFKPTIGHQFVKSIEEHGKLLRNYSQNIDTLENQAGIERLVECHGSFARATCTSCKFSLSGDDIKEDILNQKVPLCPHCVKLPEGPNDGLGVMKPNIVFFGEQLGETFHASLEADKKEVDLLIVIGSSLKVRPVALIPRSIPASVPQILINKEPLDHMNFDIELLGNCDEIIQELCLKLEGDWTKICQTGLKPLNELSGPSHIEVPTSNPKPTSETQTTIVYNATGETETASPEINVIDDDSAIPDHESNNDDEDDWTDIEDVQDSSTTDSEAFLTEKIDLSIPESSYVYLKPNKYLFPGVELTRCQMNEMLRGEGEPFLTE